MRFGGGGAAYITRARTHLMGRRSAVTARSLGSTITTRRIHRWLTRPVGGSYT